MVEVLHNCGLAPARAVKASFERRQHPLCTLAHPCDHHNGFDMDSRYAAESPVCPGLLARLTSIESSSCVTQSREQYSKTTIRF